MMLTEFAHIRENIALALAQLFSHKFRSFLTVLGVTIGVLAVTSIAAIIHGLNSNVMERVLALGSNSFFATKHEVGVSMGHPDASVRQRKDFTRKDITALQDKKKVVKVVSPFLTAQSMFGDKFIVKYRDERAESPITRGVESNFIDSMGTVIIQEGRFISMIDSLNKMRVAVLGHAIASSLFPIEDPIGKEIRINGSPFRIVGVLEHQEGLFVGFSEDNYVLIPLGTFQRMWPENKDIGLAFSVEDPADMPAAMEEVEYILRTSRKVPYNAPNDFSIFTANFLKDLWEQLTFALFIITIAIASIGLMVGGIGVMNIMLVSVKERTREIGIRKAIGARRLDIMAQFIVEAVSLTSLGGVIGIILSGIVTLIINLTIPSLPAQISPFWISMAVIVSMSVGLIFGLWPAYKASRLDPIECLRYE